MSDDNDDRDPYQTPPAERTTAQAWRIVLDHRRLAVFLARISVRPSEDLEDLCQEALLGLLDAARRHDPCRSDNFAAFARLWIKGRISSVRRGRHVRVTTGIPLEGFDLEEIPTSTGLAPDERARLSAALAALPERQQTILRAYDLSGETYEAIASALGIGWRRVRALRTVALAALRATLQVDT